MSKKALLVVSFGTTYHDTRKKTIEACEQDLQEAFPNYTFFRAYTSQIIINHLARRDGLIIPNPTEALDQIYELGYDEVLIQSLHIICGSEYHKLCEDVSLFQSKFKKITIGRPLLTTISDYQSTVLAVSHTLPLFKEEEALVFMGHGTYHFMFPAYCALEYMFQEANLPIYIGTVEGYPTFKEVLDKLKRAGIKKVYLAPFMLVAGDHATLDMSGDDPDTWKSQLLDAQIEPIILLQGLGENPNIRKLFIDHAKESLN